MKAKYLMVVVCGLALSGCSIPHQINGRATFTIDCKYTNGNDCVIDVPHESDVMVDGNRVVVRWKGVE